MKLRPAKLLVLDKNNGKCSHLKMTKVFPFFSPGASSVFLKVEIHDDSAIGQQHIDLATTFGVDLGNPSAPVEAKKYVVAFVKKIFLQREKLSLGHLTDYLESGITKLWQEVLTTLESSERKLLDIRSGSLVFTLFCPSVSSARELTGESWTKTLKVNMEKLMKEIG